MTKITIGIAHETDGAKPLSRGHLRITDAQRRVDGGLLLLPQSFTVTLDGEQMPTITLDEGTIKVVEEFIPGAGSAASRAFTVPAPVVEGETETPVMYSALTFVDPESLAPVEDAPLLVQQQLNALDASKADKSALGTAAAEDSTAFATAEQGGKADTAVQPATLDDTIIDDAALPTDVPGAIYLKAGEFVSGAGGPALSAIGGRWPGWVLRDSNSDRINTTFRPPARWGLVDVDIVWSKAANATTGEVVVRLGWLPVNVGNGPSSPTYTSNLTLVADAQQNELRRSRIASGLDVSKAREGTALLMIERLGNETADTLATTINIIGVIVTPRFPYDGTLTENGTYYWMNEPYLIADEDTDRMYCSFVTSEGDLGVSALNVTTGTVSQFTLASRFYLDDHAAPALLVMPDGNLMAIYSKHSVVNEDIYLRKTTTPGDISAWGDTVTITLGDADQPCYPKPAYIGDRLYVFFRNTTNHAFIYSDDDGATWSSVVRFITGSTGWRPYVNYVTSPGRIDFIATDDNPNPTGSYSNLYHFYLDGETLKKSDGVTITTLSALEASPTTGITTANMTKFYDHSGDGDAWCYDVQIDDDGHPRVVFATFGNLNDHRYYYARWTGSTWSSNPMTYAGGSPYEDPSSGEPRYSGGLGILPSDTNVVYLSRWKNYQMEIERWVTDDGGFTWESENITEHSREKQFRPQSPNGHFEGCPEVVWLAGWYSKFTRFHTRIVYQS